MQTIHTMTEGQRTMAGASYEYAAGFGNAVAMMIGESDVNAIMSSTEYRAFSAATRAFWISLAKDGHDAATERECRDKFDAARLALIAANR